MEVETFLKIMAGCGVLVFILIMTIRSKNREIDKLKSDHQREEKRYLEAIAGLKSEAESGNFDGVRNYAYATDLRDELKKLVRKKDYHYQLLQEELHKLKKAYLIARKKSEIGIVQEMEDAVKADYENIASTPSQACGYIAGAMADFYTTVLRDSATRLAWMHQVNRSERIGEVRLTAETLIKRAKIQQYKVEAILLKIMEEYSIENLNAIAEKCGFLNIELELQNLTDFENTSINTLASMADMDAVNRKLKNDITRIKKDNDALLKKIEEYKNFRDIRWEFLRDTIQGYQQELSSNLTAIPYMSKMIADIMTADIDMMAWALSWGNNQERKKKVASLNSIKKEFRDQIEQMKWAEYQLAYLLEVYPALQDVIDTEFKELKITFNELDDYDPTSRYLSKEEWESLSESERNQLALDRYVESRQKSNWQIGRDYELYCGYRYEQSGYLVDYHGSYKGLEDLGRDLIIKKDTEVRIVQCKFWSKNKQIHENHVMQLYGSVVEYNIDNNANAQGILLTNTCLSEKAKQFAARLGIIYREYFEMAEFPRIKCNINRDDFGGKTYIYHLPMDLNYDKTKIDSPGEFMALTVKEAEDAGFRRAYKWHGIED